MEAFIDALKYNESPETMNELSALEYNCDYYGNEEPYITALDEYGLYYVNVPYLAPKLVSYREEYKELCRLFKEIITLREKIVADITEYIRKKIT